MNNLNYVPLIEGVKFILAGVILFLFVHDIPYFTATTMILFAFSLWLSYKMKYYVINDNVNSLFLEDYKVSIVYKDVDGELLWKASSPKFPDLVEYANSRREVKDLMINSIKTTERVLNNG